jgi:hypothetical protein
MHLQEKFSIRKNSSLQKSWWQLWVLKFSCTCSLIPLNEMDEMRFQNKVSLTTDEFETLANNIKLIFSFMKEQINWYGFV